MTNKVFVYGSLRDGSPATHMLTGWELRDYGRFPFIKENPEASVYGNVLKVSDADLADFDYIEGVKQRFYKRIQVVVANLSKDKESKVWVYVPDQMLEGDDSEYPVVASGDWLNHPTKQKNIFTPFRHA